MKFYSTNNPTQLVTLEEAVLNALPPDNGLYMPERIPVFAKSYFEDLLRKSLQEISLDIATAFLKDDIDEGHLKKIVDAAISFDAPLVKIEENIFALELFHGPTLAFKDFGARFMSHVLSYFAQRQKQPTVILVATSGDTGSAVANGFLGVSNTKVVVLYPSGKVSEIQEKQFTALGKNITAIEVSGTFDDCQRLVKQAFLDVELNEKVRLSSANSINIARLIPQVFYYFYAWSRLPKKESVVFSVPSGNFGNLTAGLIAKKMGLPIKHFVAATNSNDIVPHYLATGEFSPRASKSTMSNAMDVGNPSNFARMLDLFEGKHSVMQSAISGYSFTDSDCQIAMMNVYRTTNYILDPHGAIGYLGIKKYLNQTPDSVGVFLGTAHPAKFKDVVELVIEKEIGLPETLRRFSSGTKSSIPCQSDYDSFKKLLTSVV